MAKPLLWSVLGQRSQLTEMTRQWILERHDEMLPSPTWPKGMRDGGRGVWRGRGMEGMSCVALASFLSMWGNLIGAWDVNPPEVAPTAVSIFCSTSDLSTKGETCLSTNMLTQTPELFLSKSLPCPQPPTHPPSPRLCWLSPPWWTISLAEFRSASAHFTRCQVFGVTALLLDLLHQTPDLAHEVGGVRGQATPTSPEVVDWKYTV